MYSEADERSWSYSPFAASPTAQFSPSSLVSLPLPNSRSRRTDDRARGTTHRRDWATTTKNASSRIPHLFEREALSHKGNRVFCNRDTDRPACLDQIRTNTCQYYLRDRKFTLVLRRRHSSHFKHPFDPNLLFPFAIVLLLAA